MDLYRLAALPISPQLHRVEPLFSGDGRAWTNIGKQTVPGQPIVAGPFNAPGWFLGATHALPPSSGGGNAGVIVVVVLVAVIALALGFFPLIRKRARKPKTVR